jgi:hypothetical protein
MPITPDSTFKKCSAPLVTQADTISSELYWLKNALGEAVLNAPAPTDNEQIAAENAEEREGSSAVGHTLKAQEIELVQVYGVSIPRGNSCCSESGRGSESNSRCQPSPRAARSWLRLRLNVGTRSAGTLASGRGGEL